jgi:hypothetical protein
MRLLYQMTPVVASIISGHCPGTHAREEFVSACIRGDRIQMRFMVEGMLAEPTYLIGHQESRLREFLALLQLEEGALTPVGCANGTARDAVSETSQVKLVPSVKV